MDSVSLQSSDTNRVQHINVPQLVSSSQHSESEQARLLSQSESSKSSSNESTKIAEEENDGNNSSKPEEVNQDGDRVKTKVFLQVFDFKIRLTYILIIFFIINS